MFRCSFVFLLLVTMATEVLAASEVKCPNLFSGGQAYPVDNFGIGTTTSIIDPNTSSFELSTGTENNRATLSLGKSTSASKDLQGTFAESPGCTHTLTIKASSPIDKSQDITSLASLDGLANAFTLEFQYSQTRNKIIHRREVDRDLLNRLRSVSGNPSMPLTSDNLDKFFNENDPVQQLYRSAFSYEDVWFWGLSGKFGQEDFNFFDENSLNNSSTTENPTSASAFIGLTTKAGWTIAGKIVYENSFKSNPASTRCPNTVGASVLECLTGSFGSPSENSSTKISLETRKAIGRFGVSPLITYDLDEEVLGIDAPIFLWSNQAGALTGGFNIGWRDDTEDAVFSLFIGTPFSIF